ncbi:hypothetical protein M3J09_004100 [Ascochyta lentis]
MMRSPYSLPQTLYTILDPSLEKLGNPVFTLPSVSCSKWLPFAVTRYSDALPVARDWNHEPRPKTSHWPSGLHAGWKAPVRPFAT